MACQRFLAITGSLTEFLFSDNGSNFRGATAESKRALERLNRNRIPGEVEQAGVRFRFNRPLASHQGGVFKEIIGFVQKTMTALMDDKKIADVIR